MKRIVITGSAGSLGDALVQVLTKENEQSNMYEIIRTGTKSDEEQQIIKMDIGDFDEVWQVLEQYQPEIIVNCAAFTAVDLCESEINQAYRINADGPKNLALIAEQIGAVLIHVSTDYVFHGDGTTPYKEEDEKAPVSIYGKSKSLGEDYVMQYCSKYVILRTAWLYGRKKSFVGTMLRLAKTMDTVRVVSDQIGNPTSALELARAIRFFLEKEDYGIYHVTCEGSASWYEFAKEIFALSNQSVKVIPISTKEYKTKAVRPAFSVLDTSKLNVLGYHTKHWKEALKEFLNWEVK